MRFFIYFSAALVWAIAVCGVAGWVLALINPDRPDVSVIDMAATLGALAVGAVLVVGGFTVAERLMR